MGRTKSFDPIEKLKEAMMVFWEKGFENTSISDLSKSLGLSVASLYNSYGSKDELFHSVLGLYHESIHNMLKEDLLQDDASLPQIYSRFYKFLDGSLLDPKKGSCLMGNTAIELGLSREDIQIKVKSFFEQIENAFASALENAKKKGEINVEHDCLILARSLSSLMLGLGVQSKAGYSMQELKQEIDYVLSKISRI